MLLLKNQIYFCAKNLADPFMVTANCTDISIMLILKIPTE